MQVDAETLLLNGLKDGIREGIKSKMQQSYNNPFDDIIAKSVAKRGDSLKALLSDAIGSCLSDDEFRFAIASEVRSLLARQLIQKFGGELEKQVNQLKSDPATRAKITLAIAEIVKERAAV